MPRPVPRLPLSVLAAAACFAAAVTAQGRWIDFERVDFPGQTPDVPVRCVQQDALGFVWIGGREGVWRHDGIESRAMALPDLDGRLDVGDAMPCMAPAADGGVWIGTVRGLCYAPPGGDEIVVRGPYATTQAELPKHTIFDVDVDARGGVWIASSDLSRFDPATGETETFDGGAVAGLFGVADPSQSEPRIFRVASDADGNVWLLSSEGHLARVHGPTGGSQGFDAVARFGGSGERRYSYSLQIVDGRPWVSTDAGLLQLEDSTNTCSVVPGGADASGGTDEVDAVVRDTDGQTWLGTLRKGLVLIEAPGTAPIPIRSRPNEGRSLPSDGITCLHLDDSGALWVGTTHGLVRCDPRPRVRCYEIDTPSTHEARRRRAGAIHTGPDGSVWFGDGERGLGCLRPDGTMQLFSTEALGMRAGMVLALAPTGEGHLWLGTNRGMQRLDPVARRVVEAHGHDATDPTSLSSELVRGLCRGPDGELWVLTETGIDRFDETTGRVRRLLPAAANSAEAALRFVAHGLQPGAAENLWVIAIDRGLLHLDPRSDSLTPLTIRTPDGEDALRSRPLFAVADTGEHLWLATRGGLMRCRRNGSDARFISEDERLQRRSVSTLQISASGTLWAGATLDGLFAIAPDGRTLAHLTNRDGLGSGSVVLGCQHATPDGALLFGTGERIVRIDERRVLEYRPPPRVVVTDFFVRGERHAESLRTGTAELPYTANHFSFSFAALDFLAPERARCAYRLEGVDPDWVEAGALRSVRYSNVAPGTYRFRVKASGSDGAWSAPSRAIEITVAAPFWETTAFRLAIVGGSLFLLASYWRYARALAQRGRRLQQEYEERLRVEEQTRQLEAQLRRSQKMEAIGRLAGGVAHDFNNMLTAILGHTEVAREVASESGPREAVLASLGEIQHAAKRAAALTRQLLMFSRGQSSGVGSSDVNAVLRDLERLIRPLVREDVAAELTLAPALPPVAIDPMQLGQVILNLVINASDAMPGGGRLTIATALEGTAPGHVTITVTDTGPGIPPDQLDRIFEPFYTTKPVGQGTGLGLATVHAFVTQANGRIEVTSRPAEGSTFRVVLPSAAAAPDEHAPLDDPRGGAGESTILLCEDDDSVRELTARILRAHGFHVVSCATPAAALEAASDPTHDLHLLLTDVIMPEMNGRELAEAVRRARPSLPVLFASGYPADVLNGRGMALDDVRYLPKPFSAEELVTNVRLALDARA